MPDIDKAVENYNLDDYYKRALELIVSGRARNAFDLTQETDKMRDSYGRNTFGQSCLLARRLIEAGTRVVEVIWPKVANSDNHSWDHHVDFTKRMRDSVRRRCLIKVWPRFLPTWIRRGLAQGNVGRGHRRIWPQSAKRHQHFRKSQTRADGRDHWPYCYTSIIAGAGIKRGYVHGKSDKTGSSPTEDPVHPTEIARDDVSRLRHRTGYDRLQPSQATARIGEGESGHETLRLINGAGAFRELQTTHPRARRRHAGDPRLEVERVGKGRSSLTLPMSDAHRRVRSIRLISPPVETCRVRWHRVSFSARESYAHG